MKILAIYLPQFHRILENDIWWGEGYTEWTAVKSAKPLMKNHNQPRIPLNENYYDLSEPSAKTWKWQSKLAAEYGIYGFCIYHYWFKGKKLLEKPMEILLQNKEIDINYCICWANESWTKTWYGLEKEILINQEYGGKLDWKNHFDYLCKFFQDKRYIKINNKPVINIYRSSNIKNLEEMLNYWNKLAKNAGFNGLYVISANTAFGIDNRSELFDAYYNFEPGYTLNYGIPFFYKLLYKYKVLFKSIYNKFFKNKIVERIIDAKMIHKYINKTNNLMINGKKVYMGTFPCWDNTPRRGFKGLVYINTTPELFEKSLIKIKKCISSDDDFVYVNSWNEWGEGCYLEPDTIHGFDFLKAFNSIK